jgi:pyrimidine deaminase RibD-like protein
LTDPNVGIVFLRVEATVGTNVHTIFGEDHKCSINKSMVVNDENAEGRK